MALINYPGIGCIVEFMEANAPQIAIVLEEQGGKLRVLLPNRREMRTNTNRLLPWSGPIYSDTQCGRDSLIKILQTHKENRQSIATDIEALSMWDLAQGEVESATAKWFAELFVESPNIDTIAAYGHVLLQCKSHFKFHSPNFEVYSAEIVEQRLAAQEESKRRESLITGGAEFFRLLWDVCNNKSSLPPKTDKRWPDADVLEFLENLLRKRIADPETNDDDTIWRMLVKGLADVAHLPLQLAMAWGIVPLHYNYWLDRADYEASDTWGEEFAKDIQDIVQTVQKHDKPTTSLPFISIDNASTRDIDDAFFMQELGDGALRLHLALACPALLWPFDSELDRAVMRRATSIYLPEDTYHMLPQLLGIDILSLVESTVRPALCITCDMDADGQIITCEPSIEWVKIEANLCYDHCEMVLNGAKASPAYAYASQLELGYRLAALRQRKRIADGAVIMDKPDNKIVLQGAGSETKVTIEEQGSNVKSQMLVAEMMILASTAIAKWGQERNIALLYRTQDVAIPREYAGVWSEAHLMARIMRSLIPSSLELQPRRHAGLGISAYAPITSPLRRYPDLVNEAQIVHMLLHDSPRYDAQSLEQMLMQLNLRLDAASQVQRFRPRYWRLLYVRQHGDKTWWDAVVTEENDNFAFISLPHVQILVRGKRNLFSERACPGQEVKVRLGKVNPLYNEISILEVMDI